MIRITLVTLATTLAFYRQNPLQALFVLVGLVLGWTVHRGCPNKRKRGSELRGS